MTDPSPQPPPAPPPEAAPVKPAEPGAKDPPGIAASILPERQRDAARHPEGDAANDAAVAAQEATETKPPSQGSGS